MTVVRASYYSPEPNLYDPKTSQTAYTPAGKNGRAYYLHSVEKLAQDLAAIGIIPYFEGPGPNPTVLLNYRQDGIWLRQGAGVRDRPGDLRRYSGTGDPADDNTWLSVIDGSYLYDLFAANIPSTSSIDGGSP